jgi:hypothetical protein
MGNENTDELMKKISILLDAQLASVSRIIVLEQAFMLLVGSLASNEDNPVQTLESLIAKLERNLKELQGSEAAGGSSQLSGAFDTLAAGLRKSVPGATETGSASDAEGP